MKTKPIPPEKVLFRYNICPMCETTINNLPELFQLVGPGNACPGICGSCIHVVILIPLSPEVVRVGYPTRSMMDGLPEDVKKDIRERQEKAHHERGHFG